MKMGSAYSFIFMQIKVIFIGKVPPLDSPWNRGTRELGNGYYVRRITHQDHVVSSIKARRGEVIIQQMSFEVAKPIEVILDPFPHISKDVTKTSFRGWVQVDRLKSSRQQHKVEKYILNTPLQSGFCQLVGVQSLLPKILTWLWPKSVRILPTLLMTRPKIWYLFVTVTALVDIIFKRLLFMILSLLMKK